jgi:hypothetical protein
VIFGGGHTQDYWQWQKLGEQEVNTVDVMAPLHLWWFEVPITFG